VADGHEGVLVSGADAGPGRGTTGGEVGAGTAGTTERSLDRTIGRILQWGIGASIALLVVGVLLMAITGIDPLGPLPPPFDLSALAHGLVTFQPEAYLWLGLIVTIATPSLRVLASLVGFQRAGDRRMVLVSIGILAVIVASIAVASTAA
jgi:uncharacterized membrane protein